MAYVPPHSEEIERAVLGLAMVVDAHVEHIFDRLCEDDFYNEAHRVLFRRMNEVRKEQRGGAVGGEVLHDALRRAGELDRIGGYAYLQACEEQAAGGAVQLEEQIRILRDYRILRGLIEVGQDMARQADEAAQPASELLDRFQGRLLNLSEGGREDRLTPLNQVLRRTYDHLRELAERGGELPGVTTGLSDLDHRTGGLQGGQLIILAARPGMGKTALALNIAHAAARKGEAVVFFSMEMSPESLAMRLLAAEGRMDSQALRLGRLEGEDWSTLMDTISRIEDLPFYIDDTPSVGLGKVRAVARRLQVQKKLRLVVVDYLQLMKPDNARDPREQQVARLSRGLKEIARSLDVPVLALAQLNRAVEARGTSAARRPRLSDLRESGAIEQDADLVLFIHREVIPEMDEDQGVEMNEAELIIAKQRNGPTDVIPLRWSGRYSSFFGAERVHDAF